MATFRNTMELTPENYIELPRQSPAIPNSSGTYALFTVSTYSFDSKVTTKETKYIDLRKGFETKHHLLSDDPNIAGAQWFHGDTVIWTKSKDGAATQFFLSRVGSDRKGTHLAGAIDAPISSYKTAVLSGDRIGILFNAPMKADGGLLNPEREAKPATLAREYEGLRVRYWDKWKKPYAMSLFYTTFEKQHDDTYRICNDEAINLLKGVRLEFPFDTGSVGDIGEYTIAKTGILFTAVGPSSNIVEQPILSLYFVPLSTGGGPLSRPSLIETDLYGYSGSTNSMAFTVDGTKFAFLKNVDHKRDWYSPKKIFIAATEDPNKIREILVVDPVATDTRWDRWPEELVWSGDHEALFCLIQDDARRRLYRITVPEESRESTRIVPERLTENGTVVGVHCYSNSTTRTNMLLLTLKSFMDGHCLRVMEGDTGEAFTLSSLTDHGAMLGISKDQFSEFHVTNARGVRVQNWLVKPPSSVTSKNGKHPVVFFLHGGPQVALLDFWSQQWCVALFAAQGYVVVIPNFTASSSFGEAFMNIVADGGGTPYQDIVEAFEYVEKYVDFADTSRSVAMGGSYGGYMINWIAGQPLAKRFKAFVNHDGIFSLLSHYAGDINYERKFDYGGQYWEVRDAWEKYDPSRYTQNWSTPMLIIHSDNDFRCTLDQGLMAYHTCLQRGIPARLLNFPDENHWVLKHENLLHWYYTVLGWMNKWVDLEGDGVIKLKVPVSEPVRTDLEDLE